MKIPNIFGGTSNVASGAKQAAGNVASAAGATGAAASAAAPLSSSSAMRDIVSRYDMTDITPNDFSTMIQQLYAKGAVSAKDMQDLSSIRADLESAGIAADQAVNLQEFYQQRMSSAKASAAQSPDPAAAANIQALAARMTWVQQFAAVRQSNEPTGVNAVA
jgi:hypothetical protein